MPHPILKYIEQTKITQVEFARRAGLTPQHLNDVVRGRCFPGRENALAVVRATGGEVSLESLLTWEKPNGAAA